MERDEGLDVLRGLAELDSRKRALEKEAAALPAAIASRDEAFAERRRAFAREQEDLENAQREKRRLEASVEDQTRLLAKYRSQLDTVKTNKEYQSLQAEIAITRERILKAEDALLDLFEKIERMQGDADEKRAALAAAERETADADARDRKALADVEVQLLEVEEKRKRLLPQLPKPLAREYQRIFDHYHGSAFAAARDGVCQGCYVNVPAKIISELHVGRKLYRCESCGRFIITVEEDWSPKP